MLWSLRCYVNYQMFWPPQPELRATHRKVPVAQQALTNSQMTVPYLQKSKTLFQKVRHKLLDVFRGLEMTGLKSKQTVDNNRKIKTKLNNSKKQNYLPFSRIGMISGNTLSPSFLTKSPSVLAATCLLSYEFEAKKSKNNFNRGIIRSSTALAVFSSSI